LSRSCDLEEKREKRKEKREERREKREEWWAGHPHPIYITISPSLSDSSLYIREAWKARI